MDRINPQTANIITKSIPAATTATANSADNTFQIGSLPPIPRWVGIAVVAATTALGAAGCFYYFYSRRRPSPSPKKTGPEELSIESKTSTKDLKDLGNEYFKNRDYANALDCYTKAINVGDKTPEQLAVLYQNRAAVFEKLGDKLQVVNECTCALKFQPTYVKALTRRAKAFKDTGFLEESLEDITTACILDQFQHGSTVQLIDDVVKELGVKQAKKIFKDRQPSEPSPQFIIAFLRSFHDDPISKIWRGEKLKEDSQLNHNSSNGDADNLPESGYSIAIDQLRKNNFSNIIALCTDEISNPLSQTLLEAHLLRGTFRHLYGYNSTYVLEDFKAVLESKDTSDQLRVSAWVKTGLCLFNWSWENTEQTWQEAFEKAAKLNPKNPDVLFHWGQLLLFKGEFEEAMNKISQAVEGCPTFALAEITRAFLKYRIALAQENSFEMGEAFAEFEMMQKKWPKSADLYAFYGQILMEMQRFDEALEAFEKVIKLDPNHANAFVHRVLCKAQKAAGFGNMDCGALSRELRETLALDSKNGFVWETIATLEVQAQNKEGAAEAIERAIQCARTFPELAMLSSLKVGSEMQFKVKEKLGKT